jgi:uncharacterized protein (TIGR03083 family)
MDADQVFAETTRVRNDIADVLASLDESQFATPSLCRGWDILTVAAHLAVSVTTPRSALMAAVIRHGGNVNRANDRLARELRHHSPSDVIELLRSSADRRLSPPRNGPVAPLTEVMIHAGDIVRPLGLPHYPPARPTAAALDFLVNIRPLGLVARRSLTGLRLVADDVGFAGGEGDELRGSGADLMMAAAGRASALAALAGPGVTVLSARLVPASRATSTS